MSDFLCVWRKEERLIEEYVTWRSLLGKIIQSLQEQLRIAEALAVNPITLVRWAKNMSHPRQETLRGLPGAVPAFQQQLITLIELEYPDLFLHHEIQEAAMCKIPSPFYARFFCDYTSIPENAREESLSQLVLQQLLAHLDPRRLGCGVFIARCVLPSSGKTVRSLRKTIGRGTAQWEDALELQTQFFGAESQVGDALCRGHQILIQNHEEMARLYPFHQINVVESCVAIPLIMVDRVAGCLCVFSSQPASFSANQLHLLQMYANLLTAIFHSEHFYPLQNIALGVMPPLAEQRPYLMTFQSQVLSLLKSAMRERQLLTRMQAEHLVWQALEHKLLFHRIPALQDRSKPIEGAFL